MLDLGWQELLVIGALALIVVGPKDLPGLLRTLGQYAGKIRGMAREFQRTMDDAARESDLANLKEIKDIGNDIRKATKFDFEEQGKKAAESLMNPPKPADPLAEFEKVKKEPEAAADATQAPKSETPTPEPEAATSAETPKP
ncbi:MAG: Sec-independent protein translocase protein TatB [Pseudomonadota bacterium]